MTLLRLVLVMTLATSMACVDEADSTIAPEARGRLFDPATDGARVAALELRDVEVRLVVDGRAVASAPRAAFVPSPGGRTSWGPSGLRAMLGGALVDERGKTLAQLPEGALSVAAGAAGTFVVAERAVHRLEGDHFVALAEVGPLPRSCPSAVDDAFVYYTDTETWEVRRVPVGGGASQLYAGSQRDACGVVVDDTWVTWISVDPTLAVFVSSYTKGDLPPPDFITGAAFVGRYRPGQFGWQLAGAPGRAFAVNLHEGAVYAVDRATGDVEPRAGTWTDLGGVAVRGTKLVVARSSELVELAP